MGMYPSETILGFKIDKLKDVVGKKYEVEIEGKKKIVIPIYHTSPASPLCYKGNEGIFNGIIKEELGKVI